MSYAEKLTDPRWQRVRLKVLERDSFCCKLCSDEKTTLHVHHSYYDKNADPWDYPLDSLVTLCKDCHLITEWFKGQKANPLVASKIKDTNYFFVIAENKSIPDLSIYIIWINRTLEQPMMLFNIGKENFNALNNLLTFSEKLKNG
jgi:hypothetical protein